jgi:hypothetical protein
LFLHCWRSAEFCRDGAVATAGGDDGEHVTQGDAYQAQYRFPDVRPAMLNDARVMIERSPLQCDAGFGWLAMTFRKAAVRAATTSIFVRDGAF